MTHPDGPAAPGAAPGGSPAGADPAAVGAALERLADDRSSRTDRAAALGTLSRLIGAGARGAGARATVTGKWLADLVAEIAPHLPVRDLLTLRQHHGGLSGDALAESLVRSASRATAAVGAAGGTFSSASVAAPPALLATPFALAAETLAVVSIELKLVAELHVVHGCAPVGTRAQVATAYLSSWVTRKGLGADGAAPSFATVLGVAARQQLRSRVARRLGRNVSTLLPFLTGAVAAAELNRRETVKLGAALRADLRTRGPATPGPARRRRPWQRASGA